jgi:hypothetical protein
LGIIDHEHAPRQQVREGGGHTSVKAANPTALITRKDWWLEPMIG